MDAVRLRAFALIAIGVVVGIGAAQVFGARPASAAPPEAPRGEPRFEPTRPLTAAAKAHLADVAATQLGAANRVSVAQPATARAWLSFFSADQVRGGPHASFARFAKNPTGS